MEEEDVEMSNAEEAGTGDEVEDSSGSSSDSSDDSGSSSDGPSREASPLALGRVRRATAGNRYAALLEEQKQKGVAVTVTEDDEVFKGVVSEAPAEDQDFTVDPDEDDDTDVGSDFDEWEGREETEEDAEAQGEKEGRAQRRQKMAKKAAEQKRKRETLMKELQAMQTVQSSRVDDTTHKRYLEEAQLIAQRNQEDLRIIEENLERQRHETMLASTTVCRPQREDVIRITTRRNDDGAIGGSIALPTECEVVRGRIGPDPKKLLSRFRIPDELRHPSRPRGAYREDWFY